MVHFPASQINPAFTLRDVGFSFGSGGPVLSGLTAAARMGRLTVVLGPNGAGKSVLLSLLAGLRKPTCGELLFKGGGMGRVSAKLLAAQIAWVPHQTSGGDFFPVEDAVGMGRIALGESRAATRAAAGRALAFFELTALAAAPLGALSGGQRRLVLFARAMAQLEGAKGGVLLLDEPDAHLDPAQAASLFGKLRLLVDQGLTVVAVLHDLNLAAEFADDAWLMQGGRLLATGAAGGVLTEANLSRVYGVKIGAVQGWQAG